MIDLPTLVTLVGMAVVTYLTRALGFLLLRNRTLGPQLTQVLNAAPGCVLIAVIAPKFVSGHPADLIALGLTVSAATRFSLLPVVVFTIVMTGGCACCCRHDPLRHLRSIDSNQALAPGSRDDGCKQGMTQAPPGAQCTTVEHCARPWTRSPT